MLLFWSIIALLGQTVLLLMIRAGKIMGYQHFKQPSELLSSTPPIALIIFLIQAIAVTVGLLINWRQLWNVLRSGFKVWQIIILGLVFAATSATVSPQLSVYFTELLTASIVGFVQLGNLVLIMLAIPGDSLPRMKNFFDRFLGARNSADGTDKIKIDRYVLIAALWAVTASSLLNIFVYQNHPHIPDEVVYLYQARFLANGALSLPAPPVPEAFDVYLMQLDGERWYPTPPAGWPALLALGTLLGAPWLVNPLLAGLNIILIYLVLIRLYDRYLARLAIFLLCFSPWYIFMAMNFMTHTFTLTCALVAVLGVMQARQTGKAWWAWLAGVAVGVMSLIRPLEGLMMAGLLGLWAIGLGGRRLKISSLTGLVLGTFFTAILVLPYNYVLTGDMRQFPINVYTDQRFGINSNAYGFGADRGMNWAIDPYPGHSPLDGLINANLNTFAINIELFGWSTGSIWLVALFILTGKYRQSDILMMGVILAVFVVFFFYYFSGGPDFGARYWYLMIVPLVALSVRGLETLAERLSPDGLAASSAGMRLMFGVMLLCVFSLFTFFPWRSINKYYHYLAMRPDIRYLAQQYDFGRSLVLINGNAHPDFASAMNYNPLDFQSDSTIYAWDRNPEIRMKLLQAFPDRQVWLVNGPSMTGGGYEMQAGPYSASELLTGKITLP